MNLIQQLILDKTISMGGTLSVKFGIYVCQMPIFRGEGYQIIVQPNFYHPIIILFFNIYIRKPPYIITHYLKLLHTLYNNLIDYLNIYIYILIKLFFCSTTNILHPIFLFMYFLIFLLVSPPPPSNGYQIIFTKLAARIPPCN